MKPNVFASFIVFAVASGASPAMAAPPAVVDRIGDVLCRVTPSTCDAVDEVLDSVWPPTLAELLWSSPVDDSTHRPRAMRRLARILGGSGGPMVGLVPYDLPGWSSPTAGGRHDAGRKIEIQFTADQGRIQVHNPGARSAPTETSDHDRSAHPDLMPSKPTKAQLEHRPRLEFEVMPQPGDSANSHSTCGALANCAPSAVLEATSRRYRGELSEAEIRDLDACGAASHRFGFFWPGF